MPDEQRSLYAVLPWPIYQEPGFCVSNAQAVQATTVSLRYTGQVLALSPECLLAYT